MPGSTVVLKGDQSVVAVSPNGEGDAVSVLFPKSGISVALSTPQSVSHVQEHDGFVFVGTPQESYVLYNNGVCVAVHDDPLVLASISANDLAKLKHRKEELDKIDRP